MPTFEIELSARDLELLGTDKPEEVQVLLHLLIDAGLGGLADRAVMPGEDGEE